MVGLQRERIAEVWAAAGRSRGTSGSGYLISGRHILTAAHVVDTATINSRGTCHVRCLGEQEWRRARIAHHDSVHDIALLELEDSRDQEVSAVRWGRIFGSQPVDCTAV